MTVVFASRVVCLTGDCEKKFARFGCIVIGIIAGVTATVCLQRMKTVLCSPDVKTTNGV